MAEEMIIRVKIDGMGSQHSSEGRDLTKSNVGKGIIASGAQDKMGKIDKVPNIKPKLEQEPLEQASEEKDSNKFISKAGAMGVGVAWKVAKSAISIHQNQSGDSYANEQLNNAVKLATYGVAIATMGVGAAAAIIVGETISGISGVINYNYNRQQEKNKVMNIKALAGDISYGRRNGDR